MYETCSNVDLRICNPRIDLSLAKVWDQCVTDESQPSVNTGGWRLGRTPGGPARAMGGACDLRLTQGKGRPARRPTLIPDGLYYYYYY